MTAARLHSEAKLDHRRRGRCRQNAEAADKRCVQLTEGHHGHDRRKKQRDHADDGFDLGPQDTLYGDRSGRDEIRRVLPGNRQPRKTAGKPAAWTFAYLASRAV